MQDIPKDIIVRASQGDVEAFEKIYKAASGFIYNIAYRITGNKEDAQEVTQDVFLKIYNNLANFRFRSSFKTWIYRIGTNTAINSYKKRIKEITHSIAYDETAGLTSTQSTQRQEIDKENRQARVKSMLNMLNPDQRACVILRDMEGLSYKEIGRVLKININTVRSRLKRAREALLKAKQKEVINNAL